ncbi:hypothetical protein SETIT_5G115900v2 [Setaria italica]|uniref:Uncharacterized protein n=1 Tax=Setaria italica TaxID=4555 RepID=A0A368R3N1_SETIT|nr:hypothetical protein SETIT_5G115900v2 [Setaria italica]
MCPHSDQLDRSLDWRQLAVPFFEWQVSSDESSSELVSRISSTKILGK